MSQDRARSPQIEVFISHSENDKELADAIYELLVVGVGVPRDVIFCSSVEGAGLDQGKHFVEEIREKIRQSKVVILLLSPGYLASMFCNCELGASWAFGNNMFPIVVPPLTHHDIKSVLTGIQQAAVNVNSDLADLKDVLVSKLGLKGGKTAAWEAKRDKFTKGLLAILSRSPKPSHVQLAKHQELEKKYGDAIRQLQEYQDQLKQKEVLIEELKKCKDKEEVAKTVLAKSNTKEAFEALLVQAKEAVIKLPLIVQQAISHHFMGRGYKPDSPEEWDVARGQVDRKFLTVSEDGTEVLPQIDDAGISVAIEAVEKIKDFLESSKSIEVSEVYRTKHGYHPETDNLRFWEDQLFY